MAAIPNGSVQTAPSTPSVVGINFGNTYASIAVFTKEGLAECIANEDGERQIACAVSFRGEEMKSAWEEVSVVAHVVYPYRNHARFSEIPQNLPSTSAPVVQHPSIADEPAYKVEVLQASPSPLPPSTATNTPAASIAPTPRSEPMLVERILTVSEVTTIFIKSLVQSAEDFLGTKVQGAVITVPSWFTDSQKAALESCGAEAGVKVLQLLDERAASIATTTTEAWSSKLRRDRTQLLVDLGASSLSLTLLSIREGLGYVLASSSSTDVGADQLDDALIRFFAADFTKKTKTPLKVAPATQLVDQRAEAKLRLAVEHTKRTISASPGAATCSIESLKEGLDYTGTVNRLRFDMLAEPVYTAVSSAALDLLKSAEIDAYDVDEIVYVGGTSCLPGLDEHLCVAGGFSEDIDTPFSLGTVVGGGVGDPTTILARGCAIQAAVVASIPEDEDHDLLKSAAMLTGSEGHGFPSSSKRPPSRPPHRPIRRRADDGVQEGRVRGLGGDGGYPHREDQAPKVEYSDNEDADEDEEDEEIEVKHKSVRKEKLLGALEFEAKLGIQAKGKGPAAGTWATTLQTRFIVGLSGSLDVDVSEVGADGATASLKVPSS
ncbi:Hsp70 protein that interacts with Zuo1p [Salix suchowensis]|nr:Hsp70 protein that interacts with Zuo1p [Salix suchowensis]